MTRRGGVVNIIYPKDYSSASIQRVLDAADSDVLFLGDPSVNVEPGPRMFDRMAQVIRETGALGNYHWDPIRKRAIVGWEMSAHTSEPDSVRANAA